MWKDHLQRYGLKDEEPADNLLTSIELVLDNHNQLVEMNRLPGENEVFAWSWYYYTTAVLRPPGPCLELPG